MAISTPYLSLRFPRPAGLGQTCDAWHPTGSLTGPYLRRCHRQAAVRLTILTTTDCYDVKRCPACAEELRRRATISTFEILSESVLYFY